MALKKSEPTAAELESQRVADAQALEDKKAADAVDAQTAADAAAQVEADRLQKIADDAADATARGEKEASDKEIDRLARVKELADAEAVSTAERLAQEDEVAIAAGKTPRKRELVEVVSLTFSDLRQASTNTWITGKGEAFLLNDGWLANQIASKLLKYKD